jgi:endonuclease/exonuclease/phosphatase family metal-dependent hydrolase
MRFLLLALLLTACSRIEPLLPVEKSCHRTDVLDPSLLPQRVQWLDALNKNEQHSNALWCETVGPAAFDPTPAPPLDTMQVIADSIAIISWNTHVGGGDIEGLVRDLRGGQFTHGDSVKHFVLLLQEVFRASDSIPALVRVAVPTRIAVNPPAGERHDIVASAGTTGLAFLYIPSMRNGSDVQHEREDRGNAVLSTFPLHDPQAVELPIEAQRRVAAGATIEAKNTRGEEWELTVFSVHFDNRSGTTEPTAMFGVARLRQSKALISALEDEKSPLAVAGDLNTWSLGVLERAVPTLRQAFPSSPPPVPEFTYVSGEVRRRIDYMFFRLPPDWRARYERLDSRYGSDHYPLLGWVRIGSGQRNITASVSDGLLSVGPSSTLNMWSVNAALMPVRLVIQ